MKEEEPKTIKKTRTKKPQTNTEQTTTENKITKPKKTLTKPRVIKKNSEILESKEDLALDNKTVTKERLSKNTKKTDALTQEEIKPEAMIRLSKLMSDLGYCSRRKAEEFIKQGLVKLNGQKVKSVAMLAKKEDKIEIEKSKIENLTNINTNAIKTNNVNNAESLESKIKVYALYKPTGYIVSESEDEGKQNIYSLIPKALGRLIYIGRLDVNSEGLLLLTNNGDFARKMTLPKSEILRTYRVRVHGFFDDKKIKRLSKGVIIEGVSYKPDFLSLERGESYKLGKSSNLWFTVGLKTGKNREIRKLFEHFNLQVNRLIRTSYGTIQLSGLRHGEIMEVNEHKVQKIIKELDKPV